MSSMTLSKSISSVPGLRISERIGDDLSIKACVADRLHVPCCRLRPLIGCVYVDVIVSIQLGNLVSVVVTGMAEQSL